MDTKTAKNQRRQSIFLRDGAGDKWEASTGALKWGLRAKPSKIFTTMP